SDTATISKSTDQKLRFVGGFSTGPKPGVTPMWLQCSDGRAAPFRSFGSVDRTRSCTRTTQHASQGIQAGIVTKADRAGPRKCSTQRAGIAPPHAEGDGLSGATSDRETFAFISGPAGVVGGVP